MTNRFILLTLAAGALFAGCASVPIYPSLRQKAPIVVDGNPVDWKLPLTYYDKDSKLSFSVSNDSANLYFCFAAYDEPLQTKLIHGGLQIWIDTSGGKAHQIGLLYPDPATRKHAGVLWARTHPSDATTGANGSAQEPDFDPIGSLRRSFLRMPGEMKLQGFPPPIGGVTPLNNAFGVQARVNWDTINNVLYYEVAIPLSDVLGKTLAPRDTGHILGITFIVNGLQGATRDKGRLANADGSQHDGEPGNGGEDPVGVDPGMPNGMGGDVAGDGFPGSGVGYGGHQNRGKWSGRQNPLQQSQTLWFKLQLAGTTER